MIKTLDGSSYNTEIARFAKTKGFDVDCYAYNLYITDPKDTHLSAKKLTKKLKDQMTNSWFDKEQTLLVETTLKAIKDGVNYIIKKPSLKIITSYLKQKIPLIVSVNYSALHNSQGIISEGHDIVLTGLTKNKIVFIDPEHAKEETISPEDLMFAIISRRAISTSAHLIAIKRK